MAIERNKNLAGRVSNVIFGLAQVIDGLVRALSLGFAHTTLPLDYSRRQARLAMENLKRGK